MSLEKAAKDKDGFQLVTRKKRSGARRVTALRRDSDSGYSGLAPGALLARIRELRATLERGDFWLEVKGLLREHVAPTTPEVVCYGVGRFGSSRTARWHLALLLAIVGQCRPNRVWLFDPVLSKQEVGVAEQLGCSIIPTNEWCRRSVDSPSLFLMPHCGKAMYDNLLWANWSSRQLPLLTIIGNSLSSYMERLTARQLQEEAYYIHKVSHHCNEIPLPSNFHESDVFNDLSLHTFPPSLLPPSPSHWTNCPEPIIDPDDPEMIT